MAEALNIYKNPPPKIRLGQDIDPKHWTEGKWVWTDEREYDYEYNEETEEWDVIHGFWEWQGGNYWIFVESSNVKGIRYDIEKQELYVWFISGRVYQYQQVPESAAIAMFYADSMGKYVHQRLIPNFGAIRIK